VGYEVSFNDIHIPAGAAAAWVDTVQNFGSRKLTMAEILEPAIRMAEDGQVICLA
jgi:gamma-glutamyltranspeptidase / glutathione hydrolase